MGRQRGSGRLANSMSRARRGGGEAGGESGETGPARAAARTPAGSQGMIRERPLERAPAGKSRERPGRRNREGYSARSISVLETVYDTLDQVLANPGAQAMLRDECREWGVWVPQKKVGKSEVVELLLVQRLSQMEGTL